MFQFFCHYVKSKYFKTFLICQPEVGGTKSSLSSAVAKQTTPVKDQEG